MNAATIYSFVAGLVFAVGLGVGGMTDPGKVMGFLDFLGNWDPSLAFVMGGAILAHLPAQYWRKQREKPFAGLRFHVPTRTDMPPRLFFGAALFGIGWGLAGFCPGPGIVAFGGGVQEGGLFVVSLAVGMALFAAIDRRIQAARTTDEAISSTSSPRPAQ